MNNISRCNCNLKNLQKFNIRHHHGIICTVCNPNKIEPLLVPSSITAYRVWHFSHENGFTNKGKPVSYTGSWNTHNDKLPPGFYQDDDFLTPWSHSARCNHFDHKAPNPYCSCGYYSVKEFGINDHLFSHDSSREILRRFGRIYRVIENLVPEDRKKIAELFFYSPVAKTYEILNILLAAKVELTGMIIECEEGYRSEYIKPTKMYLLLGFNELFNISNYFASILGKDEQETIYTTYKWIQYLENYFTQVTKLYNLDFELCLSINTNKKLENFPSSNLSYLPIKYHPFINGKVRETARVVESANMILKKELPNLKNLIIPKQNLNSNVIEMRSRTRTVYKGNIDYRQWEGRYRSIELFNPARFNLNEYLDMYCEILLSFAQLNKALSSNSISRGNILAYPDMSEVFGFNYHSYVEYKYEASNLIDYNFKANHHPQFWFPTLNSLLEKKNKTPNQKFGNE